MEKTEHKDGSVSYNVTSLHYKDGCRHVFKRKRSTAVECTLCGFGMRDDPGRPFPINKVNEYYKETS